MTPEVVMVVGCQASGKTSISQDYTKRGYVHVNRDAEGGTIKDLIPLMVAELKANRSVVLDNTFPTPEVRQPFIAEATRLKVPVRCIIMDTKIEDAQVNALNRMWDRYGQVFMTAEEIKAHSQAKKDSNIFPPVVLFRYRNEYEAPTTGEGFSKVEKVKFKRRPLPAVFSEKAVIFDYDGTLRETVGGNGKYPCQVSEVRAFPGRGRIMQRYFADGYLLLGASNQSGISKGSVTKEQVEACFDETNRQLGVKMTELRYCPHLPPKDSCYCVKPQSGMGVYFIRKYSLNPALCIYVGDQTKDKTWADRLGFQYVDHEEFFK
jgi:HAD superfamily hydrolase (TIGR01662 family)